MTEGNRRSVLLLLAAGAAMLSVALLLGWYTVSATSPSVSVTQTFYTWGTQTTNTLGGSTPASYSATYADAYLAHTGILYEIAIAMLLTAVALAVFAVFRRARSRGGRGGRTIVAVAILAAALATSLPILLVVAQPPLACEDAKNFPPSLGQPGGTRGAGSACSWQFYLGGGTWSNPGSGPGPGQSFFGQRSEGASSAVWGPSVGWFLALGSAGVLWLGAVLEYRDLRLADPTRAVPGTHRVPPIDAANRR